MELQTQRKGSCLTLAVDGEITMDNAQRLKDETRKLIDEAAEGVFVLDMAAVPFIDSTGIGFLIVLKSRLEEKDKKLVLYRPSSQTRKILELVQLDGFFTIARDHTELAPYS